MFGRDRLREIIRCNAEKSAAGILNMVYEELNRFTASQKSEDDITLVIVKVAGLSS